MANTQSTRRRRGSIRPNGAGFQVRVHAGCDPLTKKDLYLHKRAATLPEAEKARTHLLAKVDEQRHPKGKITVAKVLDQWMDVARIHGKPHFHDALLSPRQRFGVTPFRVRRPRDVVDERADPVAQLPVHVRVEDEGVPALVGHPRRGERRRGWPGRRRLSGYGEVKC